MITLHITAEERSGKMATSYHSLEGPATSAEVAHMNEIVNAVIKYLADRGMSGMAVSRINPDPNGRN